MTTSHTTPLIFSDVLSQSLNYNVYLKLETLQPAHSFKYRGMSSFIQHVRREKGDRAHVVIASGGNAAIGAACAARGVGLKCSTFMPLSTPDAVVAYVRRQGADVYLEGDEYFHALQRAEKFLKDDPEGLKVGVPAYDDPILWEGIMTMVTEMAGQLPAGVIPDKIVCAVGGASLLAGIIIGCQRVGWSNASIIALETHGAASFYQSHVLNTRPDYVLPPGVTSMQPEADGPQLAQLDAITSRAKTLGARAVSYGALKLSLAHPGGVTPVSVRDEDAMQAAIEFADQQKILVELSCATTMTSAYNPALAQRLFGPGDASGAKKTVIFIVCGGFNVSVDDLTRYKAHLKSDQQDKRPILVAGEPL